MTRTLGSLICFSAVLAVAGCVGPATEPVAVEAPTASEEPANLLGGCVEVTPAVLAAVNGVLTGDHFIPDAVGLKDEKSGMWWISGPIEPTAEGHERSLGLWATDQDVTGEDFTGELWSVDGGARGFSTAPATVETGFDPEKAWAHGCYTSNYWRR